MNPKNIYIFKFINKLAMRILSNMNNLIIMQYISSITITNQVLTVDICEMRHRIAN